MTLEEAKAFGVIMARVSKAIMECEKTEHIDSLASVNSVPHLHMHLTPRYPNTPKQYWGPNDVYDWEDAPMGDNSEVVKLCTRIRAYLERNSIEDFSWIGSQDNFIDHPNLYQINHVIVGRYGNSDAGQYKNEDGCLVWLDEKQDWEFSILLDAHNTSESAQIIIGQFFYYKDVNMMKLNIYYHYR